MQYGEHDGDFKWLFGFELDHLLIDMRRKQNGLDEQNFEELRSI